jgi:hypothetical protein
MKTRWRRVVEVTKNKRERERERERVMTNVLNLRFTDFVLKINRSLRSTFVITFLSTLRKRRQLSDKSEFPPFFFHVDMIR